MNVIKTTFNKALDNKEISSLIAAIGIKFDGRKPIFDGLRYHKIILMTDADSDGGHILCLLLAFFHKYLKEVIDGGFLYIADLPLYKVKTTTGKTYYLKDDSEMEDFKKNNTGKLEINRFKGLGEMNSEQLEQFAMNPSTRKLKKIFINDEALAQETVNSLMGNDIEKRKKFLVDSLDLGKDI